MEGVHFSALDKEILHVDINNTSFLLTFRGLIFRIEKMSLTLRPLAHLSGNCNNFYDGRATRYEVRVYQIRDTRYEVRNMRDEIRARKQKAAR